MRCTLLFICPMVYAQWRVPWLLEPDTPTCQYRYTLPGGGGDAAPMSLDLRACEVLRKFNESRTVNLATLRTKSQKGEERVYPQLVTGFNSRFLRRFALHWANWANHIPKNDKVIVYNLDSNTSLLQSHELREAKYRSKLESSLPKGAMDRIELRQFPFDDYPPHLKTLRNYAFKPAIMALIAAEFGGVMWMDTSIMFKERARILPDFVVFDEPLEWRSALRAKVTTVGKEQSEGCAFYHTGDTGHSIGFATHKDMFTFLPSSDPAKVDDSSFSMYEGQLMVYNTECCKSIILTPALACALSPQCIAPQGAIRDCPVDRSKLHQCHRYDQSAFSILMSNLCGHGPTGCTMSSPEFSSVTSGVLTRPVRN